MDMNMNISIYVLGIIMSIILTVVGMFIIVLVKYERKIKYFKFMDFIFLIIGILLMLLSLYSFQAFGIAIGIF